MRPGAQVNEIAVLEIGNRLALGNVCQVAELELARVRPLAQPAQPAALGILDRLLARDDDFLEGVVRLDLLLHLRLDLREILRRDAVRQIHVVVKPVLDRRPGGELGVRPEPQNGGGHDVRGGMADAFQLGHLARGRLKFCVRQTLDPRFLAFARNDKTPVPCDAR